MIKLTCRDFPWHAVDVSCFAASSVVVSCVTMLCRVMCCRCRAVPCVAVSVSCSCCVVCCLVLACHEVDLPCHVVVVSDLFDFAPRPYLIFAPVFVIIIFCSTFLNFFYLYYDHLQV